MYGKLKQTGGLCSVLGRWQAVCLARSVALCPWLCRCRKLQRREVLRCAWIPILGRTGCGRLRNGLGWCCPSDELHGTAARAGALRAVRSRSSEIRGKQKLPGRFCTEPQVWLSGQIRLYFLTCLAAGAVGRPSEC